MNPNIKSIKLCNTDSKDRRRVEVEIKNGSTVIIQPLNAVSGPGFYQTGCTQTEASMTVEVAFLFSAWLNGADLG